jgi:hypothetical protein
VPYSIQDILLPSMTCIVTTSATYMSCQDPGTGGRTLAEQFYFNQVRWSGRLL